MRQGSTFSYYPGMKVYVQESEESEQVKEAKIVDAYHWLGDEYYIVNYTSEHSSYLRRVPFGRIVNTN